jgi:hypothetical protein
LTTAVDRTKKKKTTVLHGFLRRFHFLSPFSHPALPGMSSTLGHEITHPITVIVDGPASYHAWSQNMIVFLKGRQLWRYVTGDIPKPIPGSVIDSDSSDGDSVANAVIQVDDFETRLEEWESIQCRILSWFINTSVPAISSLLPRLETGQAAWSFLATRNNCTYDFPWNFILKSSFIRCAKNQVSLFLIITHRLLLCGNN